MDYNFHSGILLSYAHSKHVLIILVIHSWKNRSIKYMKSVIPNMGINFFLYLKQKHFCGENFSAREFWNEFVGLTSWRSAFLDLHTPPNSEIMLGNWQPASYRQIKYLESNLLCVNVVSLSVGKQHDIAF